MRATEKEAIERLRAEHFERSNTCARPSCIVCIFLVNYANEQDANGREATP